MPRGTEEMVVRNEDDEGQVSSWKFVLDFILIMKEALNGFEQRKKGT